MRWFVVAATSFCVLIASAGVLYRAATGPIRVFTNVATSAPAFTGSTTETESDLGSRWPVAARALPDGVSDEQHSVLSEELHEPIRASHSASPAAPMAGRKPPLPAPSQRGSEVDDLAKQLAPAFAREAADLSAQKSPVMPEVEHELLETWKEQKQILAGQRDTIDTVLHEER